MFLLVATASTSISQPLLALPCWLWAFKKHPTPPPPSYGYSHFCCASQSRRPPIGERRAAPRGCESFPVAATAQLISFLLFIDDCWPSYPDRSPHPRNIFKTWKWNDLLLTYQSHPFACITVGFSGRTEEMFVSMRMALRRPWGPAHSVGTWTFL